MKPFDWKRKFNVPFIVMDNHDGFERYRIENETGEGMLTARTVFSGIQAIHIDLHMHRCDNLLEPNQNVIMISFCLDGRFESDVNKRFCYYVSAGDFAIGYVGKEGSCGRFPTGRFQGINIFLEAETFARDHAEIIQGLEIDMERIRALAFSRPRYFVLRRNPALETIRTAIADGFRTKNVPLLKIRIMDLLMFLSGLSDAAANDYPAYLNKSKVNLAESVHTRLQADLSRHTTIEQLASELGAGATALKTAFKSVYGIPIYQYQKDLRLQKAQRLLRETELPVAAIATEVGYSNPAKFSSAFKKRFGLSPTEYKGTTDKKMDQNI